MTAETEKSKEARVKKITFTCKFCGKVKPIDKMVTLPGIFPPTLACRDCQKIMQ
jgi:transcription elongation factor Elf1